MDSQLKQNPEENNGEIVSYRNILLPVSRPESVGNLVKIACDLLEPGGKLQSPQRYRSPAAAAI